MTSVYRTIPRPQRAVFAAIADPTTYPRWLVGCKDIRSVDPSWPSPGSAFHHRVGLVGPVTIPDESVVIDVEEPNRLTLEVKVRPLGRGKVRFELAEREGPEGVETLISFEEFPLGLLAPARPLLAPLTVARNVVSLHQLEEFLLETTPNQLH